MRLAPFTLKRAIFASEADLCQFIASMQQKWSAIAHSCSCPAQITSAAIGIKLDKNKVRSGGSGDLGEEEGEGKRVGK
jgi:hypothetical protein